METTVQDTTAELARRVAALRIETVPEEVRVAARRVLLDAFACALAGSAVDVGALVPSLARGAFGGGSAALLATGERVSPAEAAFVNGTHVHGLNFDANGARGGHVGLVALAPVLAAAQTSPLPVSGRDLLAASIAASEVAERLAVAARSVGDAIRGRRDGGWLLGQVLGYVAAASGAARVLGLDATASHSALGLAVMQAAGTKQIMIEGDAPAKGLYGGFACLGGLLAATLAAGGIGAEVRALEGDAGLMPVFFELDGEALAGELETFGHEWSKGAVLKRWPASGVVQRYVDAAIALRNGGATAERIARVEVVGEEGERDWFEPAARRRAPDNAAAAGNSVLFGVACALAHGALRVIDLAPGDDGRLGGPVVQAVLTKSGHRLGGVPSVTVMRTDGTEVVERCDDVGPTLGDDALLAKLIEANDAAGRPRARTDLEEIARGLLAIEEITDVRSLFASANHRGREGGGGGPD